MPRLTQRSIRETHRYRIHVRHSHVTDPLLQRLSIAVRSDERVLGADRGQPGNVSFYDEASADATYTLIVTLHAPEHEESALLRPFAAPLLTIEQRFRIDGSGRPIGISGTTNGRRTEGWCNRVSPLGTTATDAADPSHALSLTLSLRLAFIDVTDWVTHARQAGMVTWLGPTQAHGITLDATAHRRTTADRLSTEPDAQLEERIAVLLRGQTGARPVTFDPARMNGCQLRVVYCVRDGTIWVVLVPPTLSPREERVSVVFARGYTESYRGLEDFPMRHVGAVLEQASGPGFGVGAYRGRTPFRGLFRLVEQGEELEARRAEDIVHPAWTGRTPIAPPRGLDRQLVASKKKAILAWVIAKSGSPPADHASDLSRALLESLQDAGAVSPSANNRPTLDKAIVWLVDDVAMLDLEDHTIEEAWLFRYGTRLDPHLTPATAAQLRVWRDVRSSRRLRVVQPSHWAYDIDRGAFAEGAAVGEGAGAGNTRPTGFLRALGVVPPPPGRYVLEESQRSAPITVWPEQPRFYFASQTFGHYFTRGRMQGHTAVRVDPFLDEVDESAIAPALRWLRGAGQASTAPEEPSSAQVVDTDRDIPRRQLLPTTPGSASERSRVFRVREREPRPDMLSVAMELGRLGPGQFPVVVAAGRIPLAHPSAVAAMVQHSRPMADIAGFTAFVKAVAVRFQEAQSRWAHYGRQCVSWKSGDHEVPEAGVQYFQLCLELSSIADGAVHTPPPYPDTIELPLAEPEPLWRVPVT